MSTQTLLIRIVISVGYLASWLFLLYIKKNVHETKFNKGHGKGHIHEYLLLAENRGQELGGERKGSDIDAHM